MKSQKLNNRIEKIPSEIKLWHACIKQHYYDLFIKSNSLRAKKLRKQARNFLLVPNHNLERICNMLNYEYCFILRKINNIYRAAAKKETTVEQSVVYLCNLLKNHYYRNKKDCYEVDLEDQPT